MLHPPKSGTVCVQPDKYCHCFEGTRGRGGGGGGLTGAGGGGGGGDGEGGGKGYIAERWGGMVMSFFESYDSTLSRGCI